MPVEHAGWMRRSRFLGAMRYHRAWMGRLIGWGLLVLLAGNAIADCPRPWRARAI